MPSGNRDQAGVILLMEDLDEAKAATGYAIGGVPPIGHRENLAIYIDADLLTLGEIWAAAGTPNAVFRLPGADLPALTGGTVADIRAAKAARIVHVHVSDAKPMPAEDVRDDMRWLTGEGVIDLVGFFQALKAIGYQGGVAPETIGARIPADMPPEESARLALEATTAVMRKAGVA